MAHIRINLKEELKQSFIRNSKGDVMKLFFKRLGIRRAYVKVEPNAALAWELDYRESED